MSSILCDKVCQLPAYGRCFSQILMLSLLFERAATISIGLHKGLH